MQKESYYLVLDQGGHATRALVFNKTGDICAHAESPIRTIQRDEVIVEHDPGQLISSVFDVLSHVRASLGEGFENVISAGLATQRSSFLCWDSESGNALSPVISWQDRRTIDEMNLDEGIKSSIHEKTGLYLNPHYAASKMKWCLKNMRSLVSHRENGNLRIGPLASYIMFHLLEGRKFKIDPANASRTLLMNYKTLHWDIDLLKVFDIPASVLPEIVDTKSEYGMIDFEGHRFPLRVCTGDQSAAIYSQGSPSTKNLYVNIGTGAFVQQASQQIPKLKEEKLLASVICCDGAECEYVIEGTVNGAASALEWLAEQTGVRDYSKKLDIWAEIVKVPATFINGISGVGSPFWVSSLKSQFLGQSSIEAQFVGVLESIVFLIVCNIVSIKNVGETPKTIEIAGGLSQSHAICQKLSDLSGLPVRRDLLTEATARGTFFLLAGEQQRRRKADFQCYFPSNNRSLKLRYAYWLSEMKKVL